MKIELFAEKLFAAGKAAGFADMEIYLSSGGNFRVGIFKGEIDSYTLTEDSGLSFRGLHNGRMGYAYTEKLDESSIEMLIHDAIENARIIDSDDVEEIFAGSSEYAELPSAFSEELAKVEAPAKIELAKKLEQAAYDLDERVTTVQAMVSSGEHERRIINTKGLNLGYKGNSAVIGLSVVARQGQETKTAHEMEVKKDILAVDTDQVAKSAVDEALSLFGADTVASNEYPIILRRDVASQMLAVFSSAFSAEAVQKGMSLLKDKIGQQIMSEKITIVDDPHLPNRPGTTPFDAEGVATRTKNVVESGKLCTYLHNLKTAKKDGVASTGNASKGSYKAPIGISPTNFFIQPGEKSYDQLIADTSEGIIIIGVQGLHSGANQVSGDFSLGAYGYLVKDGVLAGPVHQITVAGNFFQMMNEVVDVASDLEFRGGGIASPSLKLAKLAVAGK